LTTQMQSVDADMRAFVAIDILRKFPASKTLDPLVEFAKGAHSLTPAAATEVNELAADLKQFQTTRTLRR
jgi:outer membrane protein OmpA-like peptidoglycan-associated protein